MKLGLLLAALAGCSPSAPRAQPRRETHSAPSSSDGLTIEIDVDGPQRPISPYIYGINDLPTFVRHPGVFTLLRYGGNRQTAYNWENNASNSGRDWPGHQNDGYLSPSEEPGAAVAAVIDAAAPSHAAALIQVPILDRVAADRREDGDVGNTPNYLETRFVRSVARGAGAAPRLDDGVVHQDGFVRFVRARAAERGVPLFLCLDNEPGLWATTHERLRVDRPLTYRELRDRGVEYAAMIADEAPDARVFGPVSFGWPEMRDLMRAPDAEDREFLPFYLRELRDAGRARGRRLLHVLDVHWYPDVAGGGGQIQSGDDSPERARVRMQLPRSLYDSEYLEPGWIAEDLRGPVRLLPRLHELVRANYPDTAIAITEYAYGGGGHPSGAVAQAEALGAFGRHGAFAAAYWPLTDQPHEHAIGAFRMFRKVDGEISFGDRSIEARTTDPTQLSAWASIDSASGRLFVVLVHRGDRPTEARLRPRSRRPVPTPRRYVLEGATPVLRDAPVAESGQYTIALPARSVTSLVFDSRTRLRGR